MIDVIVKKRDKGTLTDDEIGKLIHGYTVGDIPDYQVSTFLMAAFLNGMNDAEMMALTEAMLKSGETLDLSDIPKRKVDKHSTGGVGDKSSVPLAAIVASCGVCVPMISGRGLGHTGGTLDKLESIPGFSSQMTLAGYHKQLAEIGVVMMGQTLQIAPADRKMYALRDVTGTVEFIPFIGASIMSKKLAEGIDALVLDVKFGSGAFMEAEDDARIMAETFVRIGDRFNTQTVALLTDMDQPLGRKVGNWPEIAESIECLQGEGPEDTMEVVSALSAEMLVLGGVAQTVEEGVELVEDSIQSGRALNLFKEIVSRQGGDTEVIDNPALMESKAATMDILAPAEVKSTVGRIDGRIVGRSMNVLGAQRMQKEDDVDPLAGVTLLVKQGDKIPEDRVIARLQASTEDHFEDTELLISSAFSYAESASVHGSRIIDRYANGSWMNP